MYPVGVDNSLTSLFLKKSLLTSLRGGKVLTTYSSVVKGMLQSLKGHDIHRFPIKELRRTPGKDTIYLVEHVVFAHLLNCLIILWNLYRSQEK